MSLKSSFRLFGVLFVESLHSGYLIQLAFNFLSLVWDFRETFCDAIITCIHAYIQVFMGFLDFKVERNSSHKCKYTTMQTKKKNKIIKYD
jgi:hypothetical protein